MVDKAGHWTDKMQTRSLEDYEWGLSGDPACQGKETSMVAGVTRLTGPSLRPAIRVCTLGCLHGTSPCWDSPWGQCCLERGQKQGPGLGGGLVFW